MTNAGRRTRVLLADDSRVHRELLTALFTGEPGFDIVGLARDGAEAVRMVAAVRPDVAVLDLHMPAMDGLEATRRIMQDTPVPIVITSAISDLRDVRRSLECHRAGAVASVCKPGGPATAGFERDAANLIATVRLMADVRVVRRREMTRAPAAVARSGAALEVLAIGTSTGGPPALATIFAGLGADFPLPILCVQHISDGWIEGFAGWLGGLTSLRVRTAVNGEPLAPGTVYLAPEDRHLGVYGRAVLVSSEPRCGVFRPSCDFLFESVARAFGPRAAALVLTGMGDDGLAGARSVRAAGGRVIAQDRETSVVHGMPGVVIAAGLAHDVLALDQIATYLRAMVAGPGGDDGG